MISHFVIHAYRITIELPRTSDVVNVLWSVAGVHVKRGVVVDEICV
jgi:hypothetical protein